MFVEGCRVEGIPARPLSVKARRDGRGCRALAFRAPNPKH